MPISYLLKLSLKIFAITNKLRLFSGNLCRPVFATLFTLLFGFVAPQMGQAQNKYDKDVLFRIEEQIAKKHNLLDTKQQLHQLRSDAWKEQNYSIVALCNKFLITIDDIRAEDTLFFKNSAMLDSILVSEAPKDLLAFTHVQQAERLRKFANQYRLLSSRPKFKDTHPAIEYRNLTLYELDSLIDWHYFRSLQYAKTSKIKNLQEYLWLSPDPEDILFKPNFVDVIHHSRAALSSQEYSYNQREPFPYFENVLLNSKFDTLFNKSERKLIACYREWALDGKTAYQQEYLAYLAKMNIVNGLYYETQNPIFWNYIDAMCNSSNNMIAALAINKKTDKLIQEANTYSSYYGSFDTTKRLLLKTAFDLFDNNKNRIDSFGNVVKYIKQKISAAKQPTLNIKTKSTQAPNYPEQFEITYKEIDNLEMRLVAMPNTGLFNPNSSPKQKDDFIKMLPEIKSANLSLPSFADYQTHKMSYPGWQLANGEYLIWYSGTNKNDSTIITGYIQLTVTNIAVINDNKTIFVLDRITGKPLTNYKVKLFSNTKLGKDTLVSYVKVGANGSVFNRNNKGNITVYGEQSNLTATLNENQYSASINDDQYDKDEYDSKLEYYVENAKISLFTDRAIYRPGQTVHYKGIVTIPELYGNKSTVLSERFLKIPFYQKLLIRLNKYLKEEEYDFYITDPFGKNQDTIRIQLNKFGSFSGKFVLPKSAATGVWDFDLEFDYNSQNEGSFKVEEYKKPSFEISIEKPKTEIYLGDSTGVTIKVRSFAGAKLNNVKVEYDYSLRFDGAINRYVGVDTFGYTDAKGELHLSLSQLDSVAYKTYEGLYFNINVLAIDGNNESHEKQSSFTLLKKPINISVTLSRNIDIAKNNSYAVSTAHQISGSVEKKVKLILYEIIKSKTQSNLYYDVDFKSSSLINQQHSQAEEKIEIWEQWVAPKDSFMLPSNIMKIGYYELQLKCYNNQNEEIGFQVKTFATFNSIHKKFAQEFKIEGANYLRAKENFSCLFASNQEEKYAIYHIAYFVAKGKKTIIKHEYVTQAETAGLTNFKYLLPEGIKFSCFITKLFVLNNQLKKEQSNIRIHEENKSLEISIHRYRRVTVPGQKQAFSVRILANNKKANAELLTTIYDASLDKLEEHEWDVPSNKDRRPYWNSAWDSDISYAQNGIQNRYVHLANIGEIQPMWWHNPLDYAYDEFSKGISSESIRMTADRSTSESLKRSVTGSVSVIRSSSLNEVVVIGYGTKKITVGLETVLEGKVAGLSITSATGNPGGAMRLVLRGNSSISAANSPLVILNGVPIDAAALQNMDANLFKNIIVLKDAEATAIYGSRAANGVIILSTTNEINLPEPKPVEVVVRKNFNETAFFAPAIHASANGFFEFEFTMPESVTEWNWKLFAHTKRLLYGYKELKLQTQLPLMVQANMPRFLYQGDKINLKTRISNLDSSAASGNFSYKIEDAVTGEDLSDKFMKTSKGSFDVKAESNDNVGLWLAVPNSQLNPIKIIVKAASQSFGDGEEHIIPVLAKKELVTVGVDYTQQPNQKSTIPFELKNNEEPFALGLALQNQPQAALINSLPSLVNYPYNCAEQLSAKIIGLCTAIDLMRKDSSLQKAFKNTDNNTNPSTLPDDINENTMPWLALNNSKEKLQSQLQQVFDTAKSYSKIVDYLAQLQELQKSSGGFTWFPGGNESSFISEHLLVNLRYILDSKILDEKQQTTWLKNISKLIGYLDGDAKKSSVYSDHHMYSRSLWLKEFSLDSALTTHFDTSLSKRLKNTQVGELYTNAILIQAAKKFNKTEHVKQADALLKNIYQLGYEDEYYGIRWKLLANNYDFNHSNQEIIGQLLQAFKGDDRAAKVIAKWLLDTQQNSSWGSTKATTTVIAALRAQNINMNEPASVLLKHDKLEINVDNNALGNNSAVYTTSVGKEFGTYEILNTGKYAAKGQVMFYYFSDSMPATNQFGVTLRKSLNRFNKQSNQFEPITAATKINIGDEIKVSIYINTSNTLSYVYIDDKRAAGFEPKENSSGYEWRGALSYYKSIRDAGMQFFVEQITAGEHTITYNLIATHEGTFLNNRCALQCMYQPGVKVYSNNQKIEITN